MDCIKRQVQEALDNALENGYDFADMSDEEVAEDLMNYDSEIEESGLDLAVVAEVVSHIRNERHE